MFETHKTNVGILEAIANKIALFRQKREIRRTFKNSLERFKSGESQGPFINPPEVRRFQFVVVGLQDLGAEEASALMERVQAVFWRNNGLISAFLPFLIIGSIGVVRMRKSKSDPVEERLAIVAELLAENGTLLRIAHGQAIGTVGFIGGKRTSHYGPLIPAFQDINAQLSQTPFGAAIEVPERIAKS